MLSITILHGALRVKIWYFPLIRYFAGSKSFVNKLCAMPPVIYYALHDLIITSIINLQISLPQGEKLLSLDDCSHITICTLNTATDVSKQTVKIHKNCSSRKFDQNLHCLPYTYFS